MSEDRAAWSRSHGPSLARVAEVFLYARRPIRRFLDVGCGPGYLLDALAAYLPASKDLFWGVELFPPAVHSAHPHYRRGGVAELDGVFDAGICMEVVEHMTPAQVRGLARDLAAVSAPDSLYLINTGMPAFVKTMAPDYLDPYRRGHIVSYSVKGIDALFAPAGFVTRRLEGKDWACLIEFRPTRTERKNVAERIWSPEPSNARALRDPQMGELLYVLGIDTARAYR
jgi:SAM-dependent methyltransferase